MVQEVGLNSTILALASRKWAVLGYQTVDPIDTPLD